jgi:hypothetical protein
MYISLYTLFREAPQTPVLPCFFRANPGSFRAAKARLSAKSRSGRANVVLFRAAIGVLAVKAKPPSAVASRALTAPLADGL